MSKALETEKTTIGQLLGRYERRRVVLPPFQRSYSWEKAQVAQFWDDIGRFESEYAAAPTTASYFLGPIVVISQDTEILLLDGQQRLATATIALAALRDAARSLDQAGSTRGGDLARDIQRELIEKDTDQTTFAMTLGSLDEPFFEKAIKSDPPAIPIVKLRSHTHIINAQRYLSEQIALRLKNLTFDEALRTIKSLRDALAKGMVLVEIIVQSEEDAYTIFETLNDRGLRLSVPDLVLNLLMRKCPDDTARQLVRQHWNTMLRQLGTRDVSRFLRHLWVSRFGDIKSEGLFGAIKKELDQSRTTSVTFAEQCADECDSYVALLDVNIAADKATIGNLEGIVKYLQIASALPLLLSGYKVLSPADFSTLLSIVIRTHIRFIVVANRNPLDFESAVYEAARLIRDGYSAGKSSAQCLASARERIQRVTVEDAEVTAAASALILDRAEAVWMMTRLANHEQSDTHEVGMNKANLEHVFPQNASAAWPNRDVLEPYIWHLGNLTVLGEKLNRQAQNKGFKDKCDAYYSRSEVEITKKLLTHSSWDVSSIEERARMYGAMIPIVWPKL